jgi:hypothetical protein
LHRWPLALAATSTSRSRRTPWQTAQPPRRPSSDPAVLLLLFYTRLARYLLRSFWLITFALCSYYHQPPLRSWLFPDIYLLMRQITSDLVAIATVRCANRYGRLQLQEIHAFGSSNLVRLVRVCQFRFASLWCIVSFHCCRGSASACKVSWSDGPMGCKRL